MKKPKTLEPIHPGEILLEEFMKPMGISINRLARDLAVPPNRVSGIVNGARAITADTALRLGKYFGVSPEMWLRLQAQYELRVARHTHPRFKEAHRAASRDGRDPQVFGHHEAGGAQDARSGPRRRLSVGLSSTRLFLSPLLSAAFPNELSETDANP